MQTFKKFVPCRKCRPSKNNPAGYIFVEKDGYQFLEECDCHKKWSRERDIYVKCVSSNINPDYSFNDYVGNKSKENLENLKYYSENFEKFKDKTMVYIYGPNGTQKTSMVQAAGKEVLNRGYSVYYLNMNTLINYLIQSEGPYNDEVEENTLYRMKRCKECDLLIIDESFDPTKVTIYKSGFQIPFLDSFLRTRYEIDKKSIIFVSNVNPNDIEKAGYSKSICDFIKRNTCTSQLTFEDNYYSSACKNISVTDLFRR